MARQMFRRILKALIYVVIICSAFFLLMRLLPDQTAYFEGKSVGCLYPETAVKVTAVTPQPGCRSHGRQFSYLCDCRARSAVTICPPALVRFL